MSSLAQCLLIFNFISVENRVIPSSFASAIPPFDRDPFTAMSKAFENIIIPRQEAVIAVKKELQNIDSEEYFEDEKNTSGERNKQNCAVVVLSSVPNSSMQSLLRKYRYDANGLLIPKSVKYFVKLPQSLANMDPVLVPLNDKAFSAQGGFVRYYKEVPPIPQSW